MSRIAALVGCLLLLNTGGVASAQSDSDVTIREVDFTNFPRVGITASIESDASLTAGDINLAENGTAISSVDVERLAADVQRVDAILVIDTSGSMEGEPMAAAIAAARRFVNSVPSEIRIGVVAFSDRPRVLVRPSVQHDSAVQAVSGLRADGETALYDSVITASNLFSGDAQRNIILLSDGADSSSNAALPQALAAVRRHGAAVFSVGLKSSEFDVNPLRRMAGASDGRYAPAQSADLSSLYEGLAVELSNQYVITYRTDREAGDEIALSLTAAGLSDTFLTLIPRTATKPVVPADPEPPAPASVNPPLIRDTWGMALVLGLVFSTVLLGFLAFFGLRYREDRDRNLARLMGAAPPQPDLVVESARPGRSISWIPQALITAVARVTRGRDGLNSQLDIRLERAGLPVSPEEFVAMSFVAAIAGGLLGVLLFQHILLVFLMAFVAAVTPHILLGVRMQRRFRKLHSQLADVVMILASSVRAGHSFLQALDMVAQEIGEPGSEEFARVVAEIRLGRPIDEALIAMSERIGSEDFKWAVLAVNIQREVGGNLAELLDLVADTLRERDDLRRQVDVLSAEGKLSVVILAALPILIMLYMARVNADYIGLLFNTAVGLYMIGAAAALWLLGFYWMRRIVRIDV